MLLFLSCLATGAYVMALAQRRAKAIRLRIERRLRDVPPGSWEAWQVRSQRPGRPAEWWRQP